MTFIGMRSRPIALSGFNILIILSISSVVASGNSKEVYLCPDLVFGYTSIVFILIYYIKNC